jgi:hypothetical protein
MSISEVRMIPTIIRTINVENASSIWGAKAQRDLEGAKVEIPRTTNLRNFGYVLYIYGCRHVFPS